MKAGWVALVLALGLRGWALTWGAPFVYHPDEHWVVHPALNMVRTHDPNPHWFQYPPLLLSLEAGVIAALQPFVAAPLSSDAVANQIGPWDVLPAQWPFVLGGRLLVVGFALVGVWLLFRAGARLGGDAAGLAAALFLVVAPLHNESSHFLTTDVPATTLLTATLYYSVRAAGSGLRRDLLAAGFCAGLAAGTKYTAGLVILVPLGLGLGRSVSASLRNGVTIGVAVGLGFLLVCPYLLLDPTTVWRDILQQRQNYLGGYVRGSNWRWYLAYLYSNGLTPPLALASLAGVVAAFLPMDAAGERRVVRLLAIVAIAYLALFAAYPSRAERNLLLMLPSLCLLAAMVLWRVVQRLPTVRWRRIVFSLLVASIAVSGFLDCVAYDRRLASPDTRTVALEWINANLPSGSRLAREEYTPQVGADRYAVTFLWTLAFRDYAWYLGERIDYLVVSSNVYSRVIGPPYAAGPLGPRFYQFVFEKLPLLAEFNPSAAQPGPTIRIYEVPHA